MRAPILLVACVALAGSLVVSTTVAAQPARPPGSVPGPTSEAADFKFPGADLMRIPGTPKYVAYGASLPKAEKLPFTTVEFKNVSFVRRSAIDGDAWERRDRTFPAGYWAKPDSTLWTPAVVPHREGPQKKVVYYLFYSAQHRDSSTGRRCIGYATSSKWWTSWKAAKNPLYCPQGRWAIDADVTTGPRGRFWMTLRNGAWTRKDHTALGASELRLGGRKATLVKPPTEILRSNNNPWTHHEADLDDEADVITVENPNAIYRGGKWYLFFSGNDWDSNRYGTGIALCGAHLADGRCPPLDAQRAYFAYKPRPDAGPGFANALPPRMRNKTLPGNKRGPGAFDVFQAPDGSWWASWNYIRDSSPVVVGQRIWRNSRIAPIRITGSGTSIDVDVAWRR
ncbi:family 43 glycosylhydrolase [Nocardioides speluncae]|uniref:family 43 glycosylhydrolase n=1 Tax=Nocardioides speluncae TaxID=2670337 RepID=UPI0012B17BC7|nr:family 43 glycosylhydrolase [Nocardioides speluncae]